MSKPMTFGTNTTSGFSMNNNNSGGLNMNFNNNFNLNKPAGFSGFNVSQPFQTNFGFSGGTSNSSGI